MTMTMRSCALFALACALASCGSEKSGSGPTSGSNEVLKGTISDEMISYDTLRSQPPAAKIVTSSTGSSTSDSARSDAQDKATEAATQGDSNSQAEGATQPNDAPAAPKEND